MPETKQVPVEFHKFGVNTEYLSGWLLIGKCANLLRARNDHDEVIYSCSGLCRGQYDATHT